MSDPVDHNGVDDSGVVIEDKKIEETIEGAHQRRVSFVENQDDNRPSISRRNRLFGRQKPVHAVFGGGKPADVILWRNKQISAGILAGGTVIWLLFEWIGYHLLTFVCHSLILSLALLFLWSNLSSFVNKFSLILGNVNYGINIHECASYVRAKEAGMSPLDFPDIALPEELFTTIALLLKSRVNQAFALFREVASGKDLKKFLIAIFSLWVLSVVGSWFDFLTLSYITFVMLLTGPLLYERHEDQVDTYAHKATIQLRRQYSVLDEKVLRKIPKVPFIKDTKQHCR